ncbi:MAG TPA: ABC transporter substrate-binding protein [Desulfuromonadales bacterium]|nr:ABC transporter substrate-binding protein [Desulfuromonadales bacterium]
MRRLLLLIIALATLLPSLAFGYDVLVLQSRRDPAHEEVLKGFHNGSKPSERVIVLSDYAEVDVIRIVREDRPSLILAIGDAALNATRPVRQTPVVSVMALGIHTVSANRTNVSGIGVYADPNKYLKMFKTMNTRRVGVVYNAAKSGWYMQQARKAAAAAGIELVVREVSSPKESIDKLASLAGKIDILWMLPDSTAVSRENAEAYFRFGQLNSVPVVSFTSSYLGLGAAAVIDIDRPAIGRQAAVMAEQLLNGSDTTPVAFPDIVKPVTNQTVLKRLNISLDAQK